MMIKGRNHKGHAALGGDGESGRGPREDREGKGMGWTVQGFEEAIVAAGGEQNMGRKNDRRRKNGGKGT